MAESFSEALNQQLKVESEKDKLGWNAYRERHKLPVILIDKDNKYEYINYLESVMKISDTFGKEYSILAASLIKIYGLEAKEVFTDFEKIMLDFIDITIGGLALSLGQSKETTEKIKSSTPDKIILDGSDYCFIYRVLDQIFYNFTQMVAFLMRKKYFNEEGLQQVQERLVFLMSPEVEELRKAFKVVECTRSLEEVSSLH